MSASSAVSPDVRLRHVTSSCAAVAAELCVTSSRRTSSNNHLKVVICDSHHRQTGVVMKMVSVWLTAAALLCHQLSTVAESVTEKLFFNDDMTAEGSRRTVQAGEDVVLECEAAGRPSPTIYWQHKRVRLNPVHMNTAL